MLSICPIRRMTPVVAEATPYCCRWTEPMIALVFGEENRANPSPQSTRIATIHDSGEPASRNAVRKSPAALIAMPVEATIRGSTLSERRPARGENSGHHDGLGQHHEPRAPRAQALDVLQVQAEQKGQRVGGRIVDQRGEVGKGEHDVAAEELMSRTGKSVRFSRITNAARTAAPPMSGPCAGHGREKPEAVHHPQEPQPVEDGADHVHPLAAGLGPLPPHLPEREGHDEHSQQGREPEDAPPAQPPA